MYTSQWCIGMYEKEKPPEFQSFHHKITQWKLGVNWAWQRVFSCPPLLIAQPSDRFFDFPAVPFLFFSFMGEPEHLCLGQKLVNLPWRLSWIVSWCLPFFWFLQWFFLSVFISCCWCGVLEGRKGRGWLSLVSTLLLFSPYYFFPPFSFMGKPEHLCLG